MVGCDSSKSPEPNSKPAAAIPLATGAPTGGSKGTGVTDSSGQTAQAAEPQCTLQSTVTECRARMAQDQAILKQLQAGQMPTFLDIAKNADGSVNYMNQRNAIQYCWNQGAHLPNARELAQLSMSLGAKGIVDSCGSDNQCYSVKALNADGSTDIFNFSIAGYPRSAEDLQKNWLWSSSFDADNSDNAFFFFVKNGGVFADTESWHIRDTWADRKAFRSKWFIYR